MRITARTFLVERTAIAFECDGKAFPPTPFDAEQPAKTTATKASKMDRMIVPRVFMDGT